ncbi:MAG TPA: glycosyltransferase [Gemmatimonadaceae bacterium]|nr:glycosyltransferase [Gemmatimonadaceae bacterium]
MRVLVIGSSRRWRIESCFARALGRSGHVVRLLDDRLLARTVGRQTTQRFVRWRADRFRPDFVLFSKCLGLDLETVRHVVRDRDNAMWYSDAQWHTHVELRDDIRHIAAVARQAATLWVPAFVDEWRALGYPARLLPFAGDRDIRPTTPDPSLVTDVAFTGTGYDPDRARFLIELARHVGVRVWGRGWEKWRKHLHWAGRPVEGADLARVCSSARLTLGITAANAKGHPFYTDRMFIVMLAGGCYIGEGGPGAERMLADGEHCVWYDALDDCIAKAKRWLGDERGRARLRAAGERFVRAHHTYDERVPHFLTGAPYAPPL